MELAIGILAFAVAVWSLAITGRQLRLDRTASGGRALIFTAGRTGKLARPVRFDNKRIVEVPEYRVRFAVGGPGAFHHVSVHVLGVAEDEDGELPTPPEQRTTMSSADDPIDWTFELPDFDAAVDAWAVVTWIRPHLEGVASEAVARWLNRDRLYQWRWYRPRSQATRIRLRNWARRHPQMSWEKLRDLSVYGEWERKAPSNPLGLEGPIGKPPPA